MVLRSTSGPRSQPVVSYTIVSASEEFFLHMRIVGDETSSEMGLLRLKDFEDAFLIFIGILCHNLEGSK